MNCVRYKCIPFFISLTSGTKLKHAQFAAIALGNLARVEVWKLYPHAWITKDI